MSLKTKRQTKDHLVIETTGADYYLAWYIAEDDDLGIEVGQMRSKVPEFLRAFANHPKEVFDDEVMHAEVAARAFFRNQGIQRPPVNTRGSYLFETRAEAKACLLQCRQTVRAAKAKVPLKPWETKALAAGWKPPKGRF